MEYILASASPRRKELLSGIVPDFRCVSSEFDEKSVNIQDGRRKSMVLSKEKCRSTVDKIKDKDIVVISGDTVVDLDGRILEKPTDEKEAFDMIKALSGRKHFVHTSVTVYFKGVYYTFCDSAAVYFDHVEDEVIKEYIKTSEPYDKAGGYAVQGFMARNIKKINGSYHTVVGLPVSRLYKLLKHIKAI